MKTAQRTFLNGTLAAAVFAATGSARADIQTAGTPGSPDATTTISGKQLPPPDPKFGGVITEGHGFHALLAGARGAAQRRAQHSAHHDG